MQTDRNIDNTQIGYIILQCSCAGSELHNKCLWLGRTSYSQRRSPKQKSKTVLMLQHKHMHFVFGNACAPMQIETRCKHLVRMHVCAHAWMH
jgi:hypothetical protein